MEGTDVDSENGQDIHKSTPKGGSIDGPPECYHLNSCMKASKESIGDDNGKAETESETENKGRLSVKSKASDNGGSILQLHELNLINEEENKGLVRQPSRSTTLSSLDGSAQQQQPRISFVQFSSDTIISDGSSSSRMNKRKSYNSLELRKLSINDELLSANFDLLDRSLSVADDNATNNSGVAVDDKDNCESVDSVGLFRKVCLNSKHSLRTHMMLIFGSLNVLSIMFVVIVSISTSLLCGRSVKSVSFKHFDRLSTEIEGTVARYAAEHLAPKLIPEDLINILYFAVQERFVGYPDYPGYDKDELVPFMDMDSQSRKYPIYGDPLPLDWQIEPNVNDENYMEHVQHRWDWYKGRVNISTATPAYYMQGMCDPSVTNPNDDTYFVNCTQENNNLWTGGVVAPTPTNYHIYRKAADLAPLLKALYEYHEQIRSIGLYFANGGSGASVRFPHHQLYKKMSYESIGCDWLVDLSRNLSSASVPQNVCRPKGTLVNTRLYNPMERDFCRDQALHPDKVRVHGPTIGALNGSLHFITVGRAVYDKLTSEFIGCVAVDFIFDSLDKILQSSRITNNSQVTIVRYDENGTVVASSALNATSSSITTIDMLGVSKHVYDSIRSLVDYSIFRYNVTGDHVWDAVKIRQIYEQFHFGDRSGHHVTAYPIPPPPDHYDPFYVPEFMAIVAVPASEGYQGINAVMDQVDHQIYQLNLVAIVVGAAGLSIAVIVIVLVSHYLTSPLQYMHEVANDIFNKNFGNDHDQDMINGKDCDIHYFTGQRLSRTSFNVVGIGENDDKTNNNQIHHFKQFKPPKWIPKTELDEVVKQFKKMVSQFSGDSMAMSMRGILRDVRNEFTVPNELEKLYCSRQQKTKPSNSQGFKYDFHYSAPSASFHRINLGSVVNDDNPWQESGRTSCSSNCFEVHSEQKGCSTRLFCWIVFLMVLPFLITTITIASIAISRASHVFPQLVDDAKARFVYLEKDALEIYVGHRAHLASAFMERPVRDLHVLSRYAGWLLFGGLKRTVSFTEVLSLTQMAKRNDTCECVWDERHQTCFDQSSLEYRNSRNLFFSAESEDSWPNGDRNFSSFPEVAYSPESVLWWDDATSLPGWEAGSSASGDGTMYSRLRALSAIPVFQLLRQKDNIHLFSAITMEADGMSIAYECNPAFFSEMFQFVANSSEAATLRPEICPIGKHGFDPRCRDWYNNGKSLYENNSTYLYVTPPYVFVHPSGMVGQSCTAPFVQSGEYVGQLIVDFLVTPVLDSLNETETPLHEGGFPILIAVDKFLHDTVVGPDFNFSRPEFIADAVFRHDPDCKGGQQCQNRKIFQGIVDKMKSGNHGTADFTRTTPAGTVENIYMAYAPVRVQSPRALDNSDFSRGVEKNEYFIYSLALAETEEGLLIPFNDVETDLNNNVLIGFIALVVIIGLASLCFIFISYLVALSITEPMIYLLELIGQINRIDSYDHTPQISVDRRGFSLEVVNVSKTMESLYQVVRSANVAFFTGEIEESYSILTDALILYRSLDNKKGISIACNNLGNMMLTMYRTMETTGEDLVCGFTKQDIVAKGIRYFYEAIQLGEKAYDAFYEAQGWSPACLEFMQHLSNRYFNRAMFLLTVKSSHENSKEIEELGLRDLQITRDMDLEIIEEGTQAGWGVRTVDRLFDVALTRVRGHLLLQEMGYPDDFEVEEMLEDVFKIVKNELNKPTSSTLFRDMIPSGRMQQVEAELMRYKIQKNDILTAAKLAIRMLVEDEYTLLDASIVAVDVLLRYIKLPEFEEDEPTRAKIELKLLQYQSHLNRTKEENILSAEPAKPTEKSVRLPALPSQKQTMKGREKRFMRTSSYNASLLGDFTMEIF